MIDLTIQPDDIHWRVGSTYEKNGTKYGMLLGYIDARDAMAMLDTLDPDWSSHMEAIRVGSDEGVRCTLTVNGVSREDVGVPSDTEGLKGAFSDALKRAAVHFGIGRELYDLPKIGVECEVYPATGKVKRPKALPHWDGHRWTIDSALGWVRYETAPPPKQPERSRGPAKAASTPNDSAPAQRTAEEQALLDQILAVPGMTHARMSLMADGVGVPKGERANADQLRAMVATFIEQPDDSASHHAGANPPAGGGGSSAPADSNAESGEPVPDEATEGAPFERREPQTTRLSSAPSRSSSTSQSAVPEQLMDDILNITGGELVPPKPGTKEYRALPSGVERAAAKAYHERKGEPEPPTLAEQLGATL